MANFILPACSKKFALKLCRKIKNSIKFCRVKMCLKSYINKIVTKKRPNGILIIVSTRFSSTLQIKVHTEGTLYMGWVGVFFSC